VREVNKQGDQTIAQLDLAVFAKDAAIISDMISSMHQDGIFEAEIRNQNLQKGRGEVGTEYELFVIYRSRSSYSSESVAKVEAAR
jgi:methanogenic corrinoid protein MtbC1